MHWLRVSTQLSLWLMLAACEFRGTTPLADLPSGGSGGSASQGGSAGGTSLAFGGSGGSGGGSSPRNCQSGGFGIAGPPGNGIPPWTGTAVTPVEATECSAPPKGDHETPDNCGCDGLTCAAGQTCLRLPRYAPNAIGGPDTDFNGCLALCDADADCEAPSVCVVNLFSVKACAVVACRTDVDCAAEACGLCVPGYLVGHAGAIYANPEGSYCAYPGACDRTSCQGCTGGDPQWHSCTP